MISRAVFFFAVLLMCGTSFVFYPRWQKEGTEAAISWDVSGYYWYLPSIFIYHDLKHQSFKDSVLTKYQPTNTEFQQASKCKNGNYVMKYSSGMATMYLPFFLVAHLVACMAGFPASGFSQPYQLAIQFGGLLISLIGLWYLRKLLLNYFSDKVVAITLLLLVIGSNYLNYAAIDCGMSHCWLFTIYVFLSLNTHYFYSTFKTKYAVRIGLLVGLATLTRPTEVISCLIPLFWGIENISVKSLLSQFHLWKSHAKSLLFATLCAFLVFSIQLCYWKYITGHWLYYSYGDQGFSFLHPHPYVYTFNYSTGWLTYSPMFIFAFVGIYPFIRKGKNTVAIILFFMLNYYVVSSWDFWRYGGRAMVQSYAILLFPMAALVDVSLQRKTWKWIFSIIAILFIYMNIWITWQLHRGKLYFGDSMNKNYYWKAAGRWSVPEKYIVLLDSSEVCEHEPQTLETIYENNFSNDSGICYTSSEGNKRALMLNKKSNASPMYSFAYNGKSTEWVKATATIRSVAKVWDSWLMTKFYLVLTDTNNKKEIKKNMILVNRQLEAGIAKEISIEMKLPQENFNKVDVYFCNPDSLNDMIINNLKVVSFR